MDFKAKTFDSGNNNHALPVSPFPSIDESEHVGLIPNLDRIEPDPRPQIWKCLVCGQLRQWGYGPSTWNIPNYKPVLLCHSCRKPIRHSYDNWVPDVGEETRKKRFPHIDFGGEE